MVGMADEPLPKGGAERINDLFGIPRKVSSRTSVDLKGDSGRFISRGLASPVVWVEVWVG